MRYLFFTNTPAQVHLYKYAVRELRRRGHDVLILGRDYGCTKDLLEYYDLPHRIYGSCGTTKYSVFTSLPFHYVNIFREVRRFKPDLIFGMGGYAAHAGALSRTPVILVVDSEPDSLDHIVSRPFAKAILTPHTFGKEISENHYQFHGFKETAYLHPDVYEPSFDVRDELGLGPDERYVVVRFNAFGSHHDVGHQGFTPERRRELLEMLSEHATVFVLDESEERRDDGEARSVDFHPALVHDVLAEADLLVADSQTMVTEAALLGTPAIRSNSFVGENDMRNFVELERQGLISNLESFEEVLEKAETLLTEEGTKQRYQTRRDEFLADKVNLTDVIVQVALNYGSVETVESLSRHTVPV
ncbi:DUF354 domain-containing protein [Haloferax sp. MBLA0076]|uniref:DUF354 domain-containing protein n=1 Tax=Haloferax litoreum TaxID=2666140 RepID=A0A6A8GM93_9EURY|nr:MULTISPECIES: DUF354 domain-containing protein [Haloferax]KAB1189951.1 DUF354 domain-containing protein [Haloferax sp. CBA1148]MRX23722.1 DUF354 domain-containing protein [Haloferax litoreum]